MECRYRRLEPGDEFRMRILILGLNYLPDPVGIGPYTSEMAIWLAARGHGVQVVAAKPYYPQWAPVAAYERPRFMRTREAGVEILRCPHYIPRRPTGAKRIVHHLSFAAAALLPTLRAATAFRPDLVLTIAPSMLSAPIARWAARRAGARSWLHIQDFELGAAFATGLVKEGSLLARIATAIERLAYRDFDRYSSISPQMCRRLVDMGHAADRVTEFRNWSDVDAIVPLAGVSPYRVEWGIRTPHVALYSGNISHKQGIGLIIEAAEQLASRDDLSFVVCGDGAQRESFAAAAARLPNLLVKPLQPRERLGELLGMATVHLLPQLAGAADLVLPSKLTNMLASGRPVVATADPGTGLAHEVAGCGLLVAPGDGAGFAAAIATLCDTPALAAPFGLAARARAEERWAKDAILGRLEREMARLVGAVR